MLLTNKQLRTRHIPHTPTTTTTTITKYPHTLQLDLPIVKLRWRLMESLDYLLLFYNIGRLSASWTLWVFFQHEQAVKQSVDFLVIWYAATLTWHQGNACLHTQLLKMSIEYVWLHYDDVIMSEIASQITSLTIVYSIVHSGTDQSKHQSSASLAFVWEIHRWPVNFPHKWPVTRKMFPFDDVIMECGVLNVT